MKSHRSLILGSLLQLLRQKKNFQRQGPSEQLASNCVRNAQTTLNTREPPNKRNKSIILYSSIFLHCDCVVATEGQYWLKSARPIPTPQGQATCFKLLVLSSMPSVKNLRAFVYQPFCGAGFSVVEGVAPHQLFMQGPQPQRLDPLVET